MFVKVGESEQYELFHDALYGVAYFNRKSDNKSTLLETGTECCDLIRTVHRLRQQTSSKSYPNAAPSFNSMFDGIASEYTFD